MTRCTLHCDSQHIISRSFSFTAKEVTKVGENLKSSSLKRPKLHPIWGGRFSLVRKRAIYRRLSCLLLRMILGSFLLKICRATFSLSPSSAKEKNIKQEKKRLFQFFLQKKIKLEKLVFDYSNSTTQRNSKKNPLKSLRDSLSWKSSMYYLWSSYFIVIGFFFFLEK